MWMSHGDKLHEVPDGFKAVGEFVFFVSVYISMCFVIILQPIYTPILNS